MKIIKFIFFLFLLFQHFIGISQKIELGSIMTYENQFDKFIGTDASGFYTLCYGKKGVGMQIFINKYDSKSFGLLFSQKIESEEIQKSLKFKPGAYFSMVAQTFLVDNCVYVFFEVYDKEEKEQKLFLQKVRSDGVKSEIYLAQSYPTNRDKDLIEINVTHFAINLNTNKTLFTITCPGGDNATKLGVYKAINLEKKIEKKIQIDLDNYSTLIDNDGNIYFGKTYSEPRTNMTSIELKVLEKNSMTLKNIDVPLEKGKCIVNCVIDVVDSTGVYVYGVMADTGWAGNSNRQVQNYGDIKNPEWFLFKIENTSYTIEQNHTYSFPQNIKDQFKKPVYSDVPYFGCLSLHKIKENFYLVCEYVYMTLYLSDNHKPFVVLKLDGNFAPVWTKSIPKLIKGGFEADRAKMQIFVHANKLNFLYVENVDNNRFSFDTPSESFLPVGKYIEPSTVVRVTLAADGGLKKETLFNNPGKGLNYFPSGKFFLSPSKLLIQLDNKKKNVEQYGTIDLSN